MLVVATPSITYSGEEDALSVPVPRMRKVVAAPGWPEAVLTCRPGILPWRACSTEETGFWASSSERTIVAEPE